MYVVGIVGGVASGKSVVAQAFAEQGGKVVDADEVGHQVLREPDVIEPLRKRWGDGVVDAQGQIIRREVARRVFGDDATATAEREFLNGVTHPRIRDRLRARLNELRQEDTPIAVLDAALLYETGWSQLCDGVVFVDTPHEIRLQRALARGWTAEQFRAREASQWPVEEKKSRARWIVENQGSVAEVAPQVAAICAEIAAEE
jgi:dephospho-CoA kinase